MKNPLKWILPWLAAATLTACGTPSQKSAQPPWPTVKVSVNTDSSLLTLPIQIAQNLNFFSREHIRVEIVQNSVASLYVSHSPKVWPLLGNLASKPDLFLIAPAPDPHFRLKALNHLPLCFAANLKSDDPLIRSIMALNQTHPYLEALSFGQIENLWKKRQLPWAIVDLSQYLRLDQQGPHSVILNWLGASTGQIPMVIIAGRSPNTVEFLRALNLALWYIHTSSPTTIAHVLNSTRQKFWRQQIVMGLHYDVWPPTTYISPQEYNRGRALYGLISQETWPPYYSGVDAQLSRQAFSSAY